MSPPVPIAIDDPDDPRLEPYRMIRDRDLAGHGGRFVAEGEVVVRLLLSARSRFAAESVLVAAPRHAALAPLLTATRPAMPVYKATRDVIDRIVGFPVHRGLLAIGLRRPPEDAASLLPAASRPALVLGLVGIANHDNVGGLFRNAAAFGVDAVLLDRGSCDPLYRKAIRVSVGACLTVPFARGGTADAIVDALEAAGFATFALGPGGAEAIEDVAWPDRVALLAGAEGDGLPAGLLARLPTLRISMAAGFDSLNVATASGIALHAVRASRMRRP